MDDIKPVLVEVTFKKDEPYTFMAVNGKELVLEKAIGLYDTGNLVILIIPSGRDQRGYTHEIVYLAEENASISNISRLGPLVTTEDLNAQNKMHEQRIAELEAELFNERRKPVESTPQAVVSIRDLIGQDIKEIVL